MFEILGRSGLDEELLALVWENTSTVTFVTVGPRTNDDGNFSREQGLVALYLAQAYANIELGVFWNRLRPSQVISTAGMLHLAAFESFWPLCVTNLSAAPSEQRNQTGSNRVWPVGCRGPAPRPQGQYVHLRDGPPAQVPCEGAEGAGAFRFGPSSQLPE